MKSKELGIFTGSKEPYKIKQITVSASRTINLGNYESMRVDGSCTIEIEDPSQIAFARAKALEEVKLQMNEAYKSVKPNK